MFQFRFCSVYQPFRFCSISFSISCRFRSGSVLVWFPFRFRLVPVPFLIRSLRVLVGSCSHRLKYSYLTRTIHIFHYQIVMNEKMLQILKTSSHYRNLETKRQSCAVFPMTSLVLKHYLTNLTLLYF